MKSYFRGVILAGGTGTRLYPATHVVSKQLLPVHDKPMIYYPLSTLMQAGIRDILIITTPRDAAAFRLLLGDGSNWGIRLSYVTQPQPAGIAQALLLAEDFLGDAGCALILGDNLIHGQGLEQELSGIGDRPGATIFAYHVNDAKRYGVVEFDRSGRALSLEEKPEHPRSNYAVTGLYFFDHRASRYAAELKPSARGELEITDLNRVYMENGELQVRVLGRGNAWLDTGTHESLTDAAVFVRTVEERQGLKIGCPEEIAYRMGYISGADLARLALDYGKNGYGEYLSRIVDEEKTRECA